MSSSDNESSYREMIAAENAGDYQKVYSFLADDFTYQSSDAEVDGVDAARAEDRPIFAAFPDHNREIEQVICQDDFLVARWRMTGTHKAPLLNLAPTGRKIDVSGCSIIEFKDGKVFNVWRYSDRAAILQQIGLMPPDEQALGG